MKELAMFQRSVNATVGETVQQLHGATELYEARDGIFSHAASLSCTSYHLRAHAITC
jgi:hypothetical protein